MAKVRKKNNMRARYERASSAVLATTKTAVCSTSLGGQHLFCLRDGRKMRASRVVVEALAEIPHQWRIYIAAACFDGRDRYIKSVELVPDGRYFSSDLGDVLREEHDKLLASCNPKHVIGSGWIANTFGFDVEGELAYTIFDRAGLWNAAEKPTNGSGAVLQ